WSAYRTLGDQNAYARGAHKQIMITAAVAMSLRSFRPNVLNGFFHRILLPGRPSSKSAPRNAKRAQNGAVRRSSSLSQEGQRRVQKTPVKQTREKIPAIGGIHRNRLMRAVSMPVTS